MPVGAVGAAGGANISQLAELFRQQVTSGAGNDAMTSATTAPGRAAATRGTDFANAIGNGLEQLESLDKTASGKAVQAATGDLKDVHDYVIAATQAQVATELTTTVRNKALEAFNEVMRMPL
jgi:flagellar hook-basal body complex protein FliE